ncbi:MAG: Paraquat-inducible protein [Deltaproteobacteria bacterium]|nr:Paraquat-inducible protein [Deltaproteobacteria bacterium]
MRSDLFKLGLFTIAGVAAAIGVASLLGMRSHPSERYHTYFDETVQGLDVGAAVEYRGVRIGRVAKIEFAPDRQHIDVSLAIDRRDARRLDLAATAQHLRTQLIFQGITGVKLIDIDFVGPSTGPPPQLRFKPAPRYIPSRPSMMRGLESNLESLQRHLPQLVENAAAAMEKLEHVAQDLEQARLPERALRMVDQAGDGISELRGLVRRIERTQLPDKLASAIGKADAAATHLDQILDSVGGAHGLVASAKRATDSVGDLSRNTLGSTSELERTLRDLGDAARSMREFFDAVRRDPDMLVKGRAKPRKP